MLTITQAIPLKINENACVFLLVKCSMTYHEVKNAGISIIFTSIKFKYLLPDNSTEVMDRP